MGIITRIGRAPGVRRLVRKPKGEEFSIESPDDEERDPMWCASCGREVLFDSRQCRHCGGDAVTANELARRAGNLPPSANSSPTNWRV